MKLSQNESRDHKVSKHTYVLVEVGVLLQDFYLLHFCRYFNILGKNQTLKVEDLQLKAIRGVKSAAGFVLLKKALNVLARFSLQNFFFY
jgi:hypothetical protein